jgi:hypothetical protein
MNPPTVCVHISIRGAWEVALPDAGGRVTCETLEEASRVAYGLAAGRRPCELIVRDAYHRVLQRQLIIRRNRPGFERDPRTTGEPMSQTHTTPSARPQAVAALQRANRVRRVRSELKARIARGQLSAAEVVLTCPPELTSMAIAKLLVSQPGWGDARVRAFLAEVGVRADKSVGSLTERQSRAIASLLTRASRSGPPPRRTFRSGR